MKLAAAALRIRASLIAIAAGWLAAMIATLPLQFIKIYSNAYGGFRPLLWSLAAGAWIWGIWLLAIACLAWLFGGLPLIALVRETWLRRHPRAAVAISAFLGWLIVLCEFRIWKLLREHENLANRLFGLYSFVFIVLTGVTAAVYVRRLARIPSE